LPAASRRDGYSGRNTPSTTGFQPRLLRFVAAVNVLSGTARRHASVSLAVSHPADLATASYCAWYADAGWKTVVYVVPLSMIAPRKRSVLRAPPATRWSATEIAPALSPMMVTCAGSPPNAATFSCTQRSARRWSSSPKLPVCSAWTSFE
jgi:hypothetical protein